MAGMSLAPDELAEFVNDPTCDLASLARELQAIKVRGYGFSQSEMINGAVAVAAPFFDRTRQVAGSLVVFGPDARMDLRKVEEIGTLVKKSGEELSRLLGSAARPA